MKRKRAAAYASAPLDRHKTKGCQESFHVSSERIRANSSDDRCVTRRCSLQTILASWLLIKTLPGEMWVLATKWTQYLELSRGRVYRSPVCGQDGAPSNCPFLDHSAQKGHSLSVMFHSFLAVTGLHDCWESADGLKSRQSSMIIRVSCCSFAKILVL